MLVTLLPSFPHFAEYAADERISGIRLNSAMLTGFDLTAELAQIPSNVTVPLFFDVKGRQLRVTKVHDNPSYLDFELNHPLAVDLPTPILFKAGEDHALLARAWDGERWRGLGAEPIVPGAYYTRFMVSRNPRYLVRPGESVHIRDTSLQVTGSQFVPVELEKIEAVKRFGIGRWFLSYVQCQRDVDEFLELVGRDAELVLKIEDPKGLRYVATEFRKRPNLTLCAAKGDLYVELARPHDILQAQKLIIERDPKAIAGSRMMLSVIKKTPRIVQNRLGMPDIAWSLEANGVPADADFEQLAWLYEIGYRSFMLCDELCLHGEMLDMATAALDAFLKDYPR